MCLDYPLALRPERPAWNKGRIIGQKRPVLPKHLWSIRVRLEMADNRRDLALFNIAVDGKLRGCDLVCPKIRDIFAAGRVKERVSVTQGKTGKPVRSRSPKRLASRLNDGLPIRRCLGWSISDPSL